MSEDQMQNHLAVVVIVFERAYSLQRLLGSLTNAYYDHPVQLIISIDKGQNKEVIDLAHNFEWKHGEKEVICHKKNLGIRAHTLFCGDLTKRFSGVILLEDDLLVSPMFYRYSEAALNFYNPDVRIAGISLYATQRNLQTKLPFTPIIDDSDSFFIQFASSWGEVWSRDQWNRFREWYSTRQEIGATHLIPKNVKSWDESSWEKTFTQYLVEEKKYFLYPYVSLSTNFTEPGFHFNTAVEHYQVPLLMEDKVLTFKTFDESIAIYDIFFELDKSIFEKFRPELGSYDFAVDINGVKPLQLLHNEHLLTIRPTSKSIMNFDLRLIPFEMNVLLGLEGSGIVLAAKKDVQTKPADMTKRLSFYYSFLSGKKLLRLLMLRIKNRIGRYK